MCKGKVNKGVFHEKVTLYDVILPSSVLVEYMVYTIHYTVYNMSTMTEVLQHENESIKITFTPVPSELSVIKVSLLGGESF